jgi:protein-L-isoaspartate O-methyltransferase
MLITEIIAVYCGNNTQHIHTVAKMLSILKLKQVVHIGTIVL